MIKNLENKMETMQELILKDLEELKNNHIETNNTCTEIKNTLEGINGEGNGNLLQYSCLENPMDRGAWWAAVHGVVKSRTRLSDFPFTFMHWGRKWPPTPVFLLGETQGRGSLVGCRLWGRTESDMTEVT